MHHRFATYFLIAVMAAASVAASPGVNAATRVDGIHSGAPYRLIIPDAWNGELVILLHGYVFPEAPLTLPPQGHEVFGPLEEGLVDRGFAVAYSAYRVNGYAVREGWLDSQVLVSKIGEEFGKPTDAWLLSYSMGAHIGQRMVEKGPGRFSGMLAVCAAIGGATLQNGYFHDARVLFDYFYPGILEGNVVTSDMNYFAAVLPAVITALQINPFPAIELAAVLKLRWLSPPELVEGIVSSLVLAGGGTHDLQSRALGVSYDNRETVYSGSFDDGALNEQVGRFDGDPQSLRYMQRYYDPAGTLRDTPILHLHTTRDPIVPLELHAAAFQELLEVSGNSDLYVRRVVDRFGHCQLTPQEVLMAFDDMVDWATFGNVPTP